MCQVMRRDGKGSASPRRAVAIVWTAIMLVVFIGMAGLVCDIGYVILVRTQLQSAADAAALAAAFKLGPKYVQANVMSTAIAVAASNTAARAPVQLSDNMANAGGGDIVIGVFDAETGTAGTFRPQLASPNAVKVVARRSGAGALPLLFAPLFGVNTANVQRTAIASIDPGMNMGLAVLDEHARHALTAGGSAKITVNGGDIVVNSDHSEAVGINGNAARFYADALRLMPGVVAPSATILDDGNTRVRRMQEPLADPLAETAEPDLVNMTPQPIYRHDAGIFVGSNKTVTIDQPGIHVVGGSGIRVHAGGTLNAIGVMFYLVGGASVDVGSKGNFEVSHPTSGEYSNPGIAIWQARGNTTQGNFSGGGTISVDGIIYMPDARLEYGGNSETFGSQLIVKTLGMQGDASITINWDGVSNPWACLVQ